MKQLSKSRLCVFLSLLFLLSACNTDLGELDKISSQAYEEIYMEPVNDPEIKKVLETYYSMQINELKKWDKYILIDGDMSVLASDIPELKAALKKRKKGNEKQYVVDNQHLPVGRIGTFITLKPSGLTSTEVSALQAAAQALNSVSDMGLRFRCVQPGVTADISVSRWNMTDPQFSCTAMALLPVNGVVGTHIQMGPDAESLGYNYLVATFIHEIMHTIGFRHDMQTGSNSNRVQYTPYSDPYSIMYPCSCQQCNDMGLYNLSGWDRFSLCLLFPK